MHLPPSIEPFGENYLRLRLRGSLDRQVLRVIEGLAARLSVADTTKTPGLLIDLHDLSSCPPGVRPGLATAHLHLTQGVERIAYLSRKARFRSVVGGAVYSSADLNAQVVLSEAQAWRWLEGEGSRYRQAQEYLASGRIAPRLRDHLTWGQHLNILKLRWQSRLRRGEHLSYAEDLVRCLEHPQAWFGFQQQLEAEMVRLFGHRDAALLMGLGAFWRGCIYGAKSYLYSASLFQYLDSGRLLSLHEEDIELFLDLPDRCVIQEVRELLHRDSLTKALQLVSHQYEFQTGKEQSETHLEQLWSKVDAFWVVAADYLSGMSAHKPLPSNDLLAKDQRLQQRYQDERKNHRGFELRQVS